MTLYKTTYRNVIVILGIAVALLAIMLTSEGFSQIAEVTIEKFKELKG